jgi:16S rRNA (guanine527-N7)-methyltransferase
MEHVSRETPPAPAVAAGVFAHALPGVGAYADLLAGAGTDRGLIGPREIPRLWERHLLNCGVLTDQVPESSTVADIGSGAGLPGLVMALRRPDLTVTLVEPLLRRTTFLEEAVAALGLSNVEVVRGRADALHGVRTFDVVTSRAVAPLGKLVQWSLPLVRRHGLLLAMKGSSAHDELSAARSEITRLGGVKPEVVTIGSDLLLFPTTVVRVQAEGASRLRLSGAKSASRGPSQQRKQRR